MEMIPTNSVSLPGPHSRRAWIRITALVLGALVILGVLGYVLLDFTPVGLWVEQGPGIASMPSELKAATFVADSHNGPSVLYRVQSHAFVRETPSGTLISAEQEKTGPVQILHTTAGYSIVVGGTTKYATTSPLLGVTMSPDGMNVVVAAQLSGKELEPDPSYTTAPSLHPNRWTIVLLHLEGSGAPRLLGNGIAPLYVDATHVVYVSSNGLASVDVSTGKSTTIAEHPVAITTPATLASPDRRRVAWFDTASHSLLVYNVTASRADKIAEIKSINHKTSYALGNDRLYVVNARGIMSEIRTQDFTGGPIQKTGYIPGNLRITRILIGSL